jgi:very-short-patch-repair endonuclease
MVKELVGNEYLVLSDYINLKEKVIFKHNIPECLHEFPMKASNFLHNGQRCPSCSESKGEKRIRDFLIIKNFNFEPQMRYDNLLGIGGKRLSYDFYLPDYNLLIEYQGEQHDHRIEYFHENEDDFEKQQEHDQRKRNYANDNGIRLLEIWYWDFDNIEKILEKELI